MYISRVQIDTDNRRKISDLTHLGAYHSWVEDSFPEERLTTERSRKLWRIDHLGGRAYLLLVSPDKPDLNRLEKYGVPGSAETKSYDSLLDGVTEGKRYRFRAALNPVHSVMEEGKKRGRVYPEITVPRQMEYFSGRMEKNGFESSDYTITERGFRVLKKTGSRPLRLCYAVYEGSLTVTDAELFRNALMHGIGRKKAYGFGLITVIPEDS